MKISDYVESQIKGLWGTDFDENGISVIKTNNLTYEGHIDYSDICKRNITEEQAKGWYLKPGDLLIEKSGGTKTHSVGYVSYFEGEEDKFVCNNFILALRPKNTINSKFLFYQIQFNYESNQFSDCFNKTTGIQNLKVKDYLAKEIKIYSPEKQEKIVKELDTVRSIINKNKQILKKYDTLIKSRFIEMFGDPTTNPMNWDTVNISSLLTANASNGFFAKRDEYTEDGNVEVLGVVNIVNTMYSKIDLLPKTNASEKDIKKYSVKYGDMLFCRSSLVAEGIGKASIVPENINKTILFECHVIRLRLDLNKCVPEYMQMLSTTSFFRNQVLKHAKTSTMTTIGQDGILKTDVRLPPIEKQKQFLSFIKQIDKSKFEIEKIVKMVYN